MMRTTARLRRIGQVRQKTLAEEGFEKFRKQTRKEQFH
jgi:hypothetical protein